MGRARERKEEKVEVGVTTKQVGQGGQHSNAIHIVTTSRGSRAPCCLRSESSEYVEFVLLSKGSRITESTSHIITGLRSYGTKLAPFAMCKYILPPNGLFVSYPKPQLISIEDTSTVLLSAWTITPSNHSAKQSPSAVPPS